MTRDPGVDAQLDSRVHRESAERMKGEEMKRLASLLAAAALAAAACASGSGTPPPGSVPKSGGTLSVAIGGDMVYADPALVSDDSSMLVAAQVVEGLVGLKPGTVSEVVPVLASDLPAISPDGLTYTFKIRTGVKFQDGTDLNAEAVKSNYDRWQGFPKGDLQDHATYYAAAFGGFGDERRGGADGPGATSHHGPTAEPGQRDGHDRQLQRGGHGQHALELSMAAERGGSD